MLRLEKKHYLPLWRLGLPVIMAQIGQISVGIVDSIMIGQAGTTELAAASFANTLFNLTILFGTGCTFAITPRIGDAFGEGDTGKVAERFKSGMAYALSIGVLLTLFLLGLAQLMHLMGQEPQVVELARPYLYVLIASTLPMLFFLGSKQFAEGIGDTKTGMAIVLIGNLVNVAGNYLFIYGHLGMPKMGLVGAGIGTLAARIFMALAFTFALGRFRHFAPYTALLRGSRLLMEQLKDYYHIGLPMGVSVVMASAAFGLSTIMMGWMGEVPLAAHQVALSISGLGYMIYQGLGVSSTIKISHLVGEGNTQEVKHVAYASTHLVLLLIATMSTLLLLSRNLLPTLFSTDPQVIAYTASFMVVMAIYQWVDGVSIIFGACLRGVADVRWPAIFTLVSYFGLALPCSYLFAFVLGVGPVGIWYGFPIGLAVCSLLFIGRFAQVVNRLPHMQQA